MRKSRTTIARTRLTSTREVPSSTRWRRSPRLEAPVSPIILFQEELPWKDVPQRCGDCRQCNFDSRTKAEGGPRCVLTCGRHLLLVYPKDVRGVPRR